jgi:hypothetical protein
VDDQQVERFIGELDSNSFAARDNALRELRKIGQRVER